MKHWRPWAAMVLAATPAWCAVASDRALATGPPRPQPRSVERCVVELSADAAANIRFKAMRPHCLLDRPPRSLARLPEFKHAIQRFVVLRFGDAPRGAVTCMVDCDDPAKTARATFRAYVDANRDGDLANEPTRATSGPIEALYADGTREAYELVFYPVNERGAIGVRYYLKAVRMGHATLAGQAIRVLVADDDGDGVFSRDGSSICFALAGTGASLEGTRRRSMKETLSLPSGPYRVASIDAAGRRLVIERDVLLEMALEMERLRQAGDEEGLRAKAEEIRAQAGSGRDALLAQARRWALEERRCYDAAKALAAKALELNPLSGKAWHVLGTMLLLRGDHANAITCLQAARHDGYSRDRPGPLALALASVGRTDEAWQVLADGLVFGEPDQFASSAVALLRGRPGGPARVRALELGGRGKENWRALPWSTSPPKAQQQAMATKRRLFVYFHRAHPAFEDRVLGHPEVWRRLDEQFVLLSVDVHEMPDLARIFRIADTPTICVFDFATGAPVEAGRMGGDATPRRVVERLLARGR